MTNAITSSCNTAKGFWLALGDEAATAWPLAMTAIADACQLPPDVVRAFLESRHGGQFGNEVLTEFLTTQDFAVAIDKVVTQWMSETIDAHLSQYLGIPYGLPYLSGVVIYHDITENLLNAR